jgi:hypothetical protein
VTGRRRLAIAASAIAGIAALAGCGPNGSFQGSGKMAGAHGGQAQVQFKVICNVKTQRVSGSLAYSDPSSGILIFGAPTSANTYESGGSTIDTTTRSNSRVTRQSTPTTFNDCDGNNDNGDYYGSYLSILTRSTGTFEFIVSTNNACSSGFNASIYLGASLTSTPTYQNTQCITDGQVTPITS